MLLFTLVISRLVPAIFVASACLVLGRFVHDRVAPASRLTARFCFGSVLAIGAFFLCPYLLRAGILVAAEQTFQAGNWPAANRYFVEYRRRGGEAKGSLNLDWAMTLMNLRLWREAETVLISGVRRTARGVEAQPRAVLLLGICRYYEDRLDASAKTLSAVANGQQAYLCFYFLGRLAERRGENLQAIAAYRRSLEDAPQFYPSTYQAVRVLLQQGDKASAQALLGRFHGPRGSAGNDADAMRLAQAVAGDGAVLPEREFYMVQY